MHGLLHLYCTLKRTHLRKTRVSHNGNLMPAARVGLGELRHAQSGPPGAQAIVVTQQP